MKNRFALVMVMMALIGVACRGDDPVAPDVTPRLADRWRVLAAVETSLSDMDYDAYVATLDEDFVFGFYGMGKWSIAWNLDKEVVGAAKLLGGAGGELGDPVVDLAFDLVGDLEVLEWREVPPQGSHPERPWWLVYVEYTFRVETTRALYVPESRLWAEFTVRPAGGDWKLVRWRDMGVGPIPETTTDAWPVVLQPHR